MQRYTLNTKRTYEKDGVEKTQWLQVGSLRKMDDGKMFIELNMHPDMSIYVFEDKPREPSTTTAPASPVKSQGMTADQINYPDGEVNPADIPF